MPANKKPRKAYRPRRILQNPVGYVMEGMSRLTPQDVTRMLAVNHAAMDEIVHGRGTVEHWRTVTGALNMAVALDEQVYAGVEQGPLVAALKAHARCGVRGFKGQTLGYTGADLQCVNHAMGVHEVQVRQATTNEIDRALAECQRRYKAKGEHFTVREMAEQQKEPDGYCHA